MAVLGDLDSANGSVLGAVLGELDELDGDVLGAVLGAVEEEVGRRRGRRGMRRPNPPTIELNRPSWRGRELAPGVNHPGEGVVPLPLTPTSAGGVWSVATTTGQITFIGQLQKPFKSKRLLATTQRLGATATALVLGQIFVGVDLNQATINPVDLEALGAPTAFDTGMSLMQAPPGVLIQILATLGGTPPSGTDSIFLSASFLGHIIH